MISYSILKDNCKLVSALPHGVVTIFSVFVVFSHGGNELHGNQALTVVLHVVVLHDTISLATCLATLEKEIHCKLQETCCTLRSQATTYNGFKTSLQSLQKVEPRSTAIVTRYNVLCNLCCNGIARQVAGMLQYVHCMKPRVSYQRKAVIIPYFR